MTNEETTDIDAATANAAKAAGGAKKSDKLEAMPVDTGPAGAEKSPAQQKASGADTRPVRAKKPSDKQEVVPVDAHSAKAGMPEMPAAMTKSATVLKLLRRKKGAALAEIGEATGWQKHSVRGFISAVVKKRMGLTVSSEAGADGIRRYAVKA